MIYQSNKLLSGLYSLVINNAIVNFFKVKDVLVLVKDKRSVKNN